MKHDDLDRILSKEQGLVPSSGFVTSVMDAVRRETSAPPPIPFPWKRALPGLCAAGLALVWVFIVGVMLFRGTAPQPFPAERLPALALIFQGWKNVGASWIALALVLSLASVELSKRFASGQS
jgi:hypothetical protein